MSSNCSHSTSWSPDGLARTLQALDEREYVRFAAHWMTKAVDVDVPADRTGVDVIDAIVAASAAWVAYQRCGSEPEWTCQPGRAVTGRLWHPGAPGLLAYSIVHAPGSFIVRGLAVAREAFICV